MSTALRLWTLLGMVVLLDGCNCGTEEVPPDAGKRDGGTQRDAGITPDAGLAPDAAVPDAATQDAGGPADAGLADSGLDDAGPPDAGPPADAGAAFDGGPGADGGSTPDAGPAPDGGPLPDAGSADAGPQSACAQQPNGTPCDDGNACTQADTCQAGACTGANPVVCTAQDACHSVGTCSPATGACTNPTAPDGTACSDGNACTQADSCQAGACAGANPVVCVAQDSCHVAGTCSPATGACTNPAAPNGTTCSDGNACTQSDSCQTGACTGANPVVCAAQDACHVAGTCSPSTGACTNPTAPNGTTCSDGNACTQTDTCQAGACTGSNPVLCAAQDACHLAGSCSPATGTCSNPAAPNGTTCSDGDACTQTDSCQAGACAGANPVLCVAQDSCHVAGTCSPASGSCSNPVAPEGRPCSDGNACTQVDTCQAGTCVGINPVVCAAQDACHLPGTCSPATGACSNPAAPDGKSCSDANLCTLVDACQAGTCVGSSPACPAVASCVPSTGVCGVTLYDVKSGALAVGLPISTQGVITAVLPGVGFFAQVSPLSPAYVGPDFSGAWIALASATGLAEGDLVQIDGAVGALGSARTVSATAAVKLSSPGVPAPTFAAAGELQTGGARAAALEAVLVGVIVQPLFVTDTAPPLSPGDTAPSNEFVVGGGLRVDDLLYLVQPPPPLGASLLQLLGVLALRNADSKLLPRRASDVDFGARVAGFGPAGTFTSVGHPLGPTYPAKLQVSIASARAVGTTVNVQSLSPALSLVGPLATGSETVQLLIPAGSLSVDVPVSGLFGQPDAGLSAWATADQSDLLGASVGVLDYAASPPVLASFAPSSFTLAPSAAQVLTVKTNVPVGVASTFALACTNSGNFLAVPSTVTIPAERDSATFTLTAAGAPTGTSVLTVDPAGAALTATATFTSGLFECFKGQVVLSQVYGGGGNSGATYKNDFIELFNRTGSACRMTGWSAQYQSGGTGTFSAAAANTHTFTGTIPAHGYFLLGESAGAGGTVNLPTPDAVGALALSGTAGKVLLMAGAPVGICPTTNTVNYVDLLDYNSALACAEGTKLGALSNTTSAGRKGGGCTDTDVNSADFDILLINGTAAAPRNSAVVGPTCP